jgi:hypothetical protein
MFNKDFYPTPEHLIRKMLVGVTINNKRVLEPSAGKGNIVDYIRKYESKNTIIDVIEIQPELQSILYDKDCNVIGDDFLKFDTVMEYDLIVMNPPFSDGDKHLLKAIELAEGNVEKRTEIACLLNENTLKNDFSNARKKLLRKLENYNANIIYLDDQFKDSERKTDVSVALIKMIVEPRTKGFIDIDFDNYERVLSDKNEVSLNVINEDIAKRKNEIEVLIELYNRHSKQLKEAYKHSLELNEYDNHLHKITRKDGDFGQRSYVSIDTKSINEEISKLRYTYWGLILDTKTFDKHLTQDGKERLQKTIIQSSNLEVTIENVNKLISAMFQNMDSILKQDALSLFESFTKHNMNSYSGNIHYYDGWKTNDAFKVNKKIIVKTNNWRGEHDLRDIFSNQWKEWDDIYQSYKLKSLISDIVKVFSNFTDKKLPNDFKREGNVYENDFFKLQAFIKGTTHITFKDQDTLDRFNIYCGIESGMLPTYEEMKTNKEARKIYENVFGKDVIKLIG